MDSILPEADQHDKISLLIHELATIQKSTSGSILDSDDRRKKALRIAQKLAASLEKPQNVPLNSIVVNRISIPLCAL